MSEKIKIILISGYGRSGSTLIDKLIGHIDQFVSVGELNNIWERAVGGNELCECESPFRECSFWSEVMRVAFGKEWILDGPALNALMWQVCHPLRFMQLAGWMRKGERYRQKQDRYLQYLDRLYRGIHKVSGGKIIVDSSKNPFHGFFVKSLPGYDVRVIHLVRDSRAVAYSWKKRLNYLPERDECLKPRGFFRSMVAWLGSNIFAEVLATQSLYSCLLRYEDFSAYPERTLKTVFETLNVRSVKMPFLNAGIAQLSLNHMVAGNPSRFKKGDIRIECDNAWVSGLSWLEKLYVSLLTWPWLVRYGYLSRSQIK